MERTKLVIDRSRWYRGHGALTSRLIRKDDGKMCCLGFFGLVCGVSAEKMTGIGNPRGCPDPAWPAWLMSPSINVKQYLMDINDFPGITMTETERETKIAEIFSRNGVDVTFVDGPEGTPLQ